MENTPKIIFQGGPDLALALELESEVEDALAYKLSLVERVELAVKKISVKSGNPYRGPGGKFAPKKGQAKTKTPVKDLKYWQSPEGQKDPANPLLNLPDEKPGAPQPGYTPAPWEKRGNAAPGSAPKPTGPIKDSPMQTAPSVADQKSSAVNIAGLSLAEVRKRLAAVRSSLANQKPVPFSSGKTPDAVNSYWDKQKADLQTKWQNDAFLKAGPYKSKVYKDKWTAVRDHYTLLNKIMDDQRKKDLSALK